MLNGAKKTTFDIARISIQKVTLQISNSDHFTSSNFPSNSFRHKVDVFDNFPTSLFYQHPIPTLPLHSLHMQQIQKKTFFFMPLLHFTPPCKHKTTYTIFFSLLNEILHKLTSCHFTLRNKNVERFMPKNTSPFHFSEQNCTIHKRTITQTHDLSCHHFFCFVTKKFNFFYEISVLP